MTTEEYVILSPRETEVPSSISFIQNNYESLKKRLTLVGISISLCFFLLLHVAQLIIGITLIQKCSNGTYTPAYFIVAGVTGVISKIYHFVTINEQARLGNKRSLIICIFYSFELIWLIIGTYYYLFKSYPYGCPKTSHERANWLILSHYMCYIMCSIIFTWFLSIVFVLVYFKTKLVQNLAKHVPI